MGREIHCTIHRRLHKYRTLERAISCVSFLLDHPDFNNQNNTNDSLQSFSAIVNKTKTHELIIIIS